MIFLKKQVLQDHSLFGEVALTFTVQIKDSPFLGNLHYILRRAQ